MNPADGPNGTKVQDSLFAESQLNAVSSTGALQPAGSLEGDQYASMAAEEAAMKKRFEAAAGNKTRNQVLKFGTLGAALVIGLVLIGIRQLHSNNTGSSTTTADASIRYHNVALPLADLVVNSPALSVSKTQTLSINGQLNVNNSLVLAPTTRPDGAVTGQLYYDQTTNQLAYYNGSSFQTVLSGNNIVTTTIGGVSGAVATGNGLTVAGNTLSNSGVLTLQGQSGNITLAAGPGIVVNGTTISNSGLLSLGGQGGNILVGDGLSISGGTLRNTGIVSAVGAGAITVTNDGNGNITIDGPNGSGGGTVSSPGGTIGRIAKFTGVQTVADSLISDNGTVVTISGDLSVSGTVSLTNPLAVTSGGTGAASAAAARTNLGAAKSGANTDITSLTGLTTALTVAQGGTGVGTLATNGVLIGNGTSPLTSLVAGSAGQCLVSTAGAPTWSTCPGSGGVSSLNGGTGALTLNNASLAGSSITINDATTAAKGIASFNGTNFLVVSGTVNTIQNINATASPTFGQLTLTSSQATNPMFVVNNTNLAASGALLDLQLNGASKFSVSPAGNLTAAGTLNGQTISSSANLTGTLAVAGAINGQTISSAANFTGSVAVGTTLSVNTITPSSSLTIGSTGQSFLLQGNAGSTLTATNGANATTLAFQTPTANVTYSFPTATAGAYNICTTAGNCTGVGGGVTTPGGTTNTLAKFTASGTIGNSSITDNGTTVTIGGALSVNTITPTSALTVGATGQNLTLQGATVNLSSTSAGITNSLTFATPSGSNKTITVPNASGTVAVSASGPLALDASGNLTCPTCLTSGGGGGTAGVNSLNGLTGALTLQGSSAGSVSNGGTTITINDATSAVKGLASFNATNLTVTSGNVNTVQDIAVGSTPTFAGLNLTAALTVGNGGTGATTAAGARTNLGAAKSGANTDITSLSGLTTALSVAQGGTGIATTPNNGELLIGNGSGYSLNTLSAGSGVTITNAAGSITISAPGAGTCAGCANTSLSNLASVAINTSLLPGTAGSADLGSGTLPFGQLFLAGTSASPAVNNFQITGASTGGTRTITLPDASGTVAVSASGNIALSATGNITFTGTLDVANGGTGAATLTTNGVLIGNGTSAISAITGSTGQCLLGNTGAAPSFGTCPGSGGVSSLDSLTGALTINNTTGSGTVITINDAKADGSTKGIAAFNATNFQDNGSGVINTIQDIAITSAPTFGQLTITSSQAANAMLVINNTNAGATGNLIDLQLNGGSKFRVAPNGNTTIAGTLAVNTITPSASLAIGATTQSFTLQGNASSIITATGGGQTTTVGFTGTPVDAVTFNFDRAAAAGTYTICTTAGNCAGVGGGVTTPGGTTNRIAKFTGSGTVANSSLTDDGTNITLDTNVGLVLQGGSAKISSAIAASGSNGNDLAIAAGAGNGTNKNGGNLLLQGGASTGTGTPGSVIARSTNNSTAAFLIQNSSNSNIFQADTANNRVGINTSGTPTSTLEVTGTVRIDGTITESFAAKTGNVNTRINLPFVTLTAPGSQVIALGVDSGSDTTARGISVFDARTGTHQPSIAVLSPDESKLFGLSWDGSNSLPLVKTTSGQLGFSLGGGTPVYIDSTSAGLAQLVVGISGPSGKDGELTFSNAANSNQVSIRTGTTSSNYTLQLPAGIGSSGQCLNVASVVSATATLGYTSCDSNNVLLQGGNSFGTAVVLGTADSNSLNLVTNGTTQATVAVGGATTFKNSTNSATAFRIQNASSESLLTADTTARSASGGNLIKIGDSTGTDSSLTILKLDSATADPTSNLSALNGGLFYNSTTNKVSLIENGQVKIVCNTTDLGCGTGTVTLQNAYANSIGGTTPEILLDATRKGLDIQNATSGGVGASEALLAVRGGASGTLGTAYFQVLGDGRVGVNGTAANYQMNITGNGNNMGALYLQGGAGSSGTSGSDGSNALTAIGGDGGSSSAAGSLAGNGGGISLTGGNGGLSSLSHGGTGGGITITAGNGGDSNSGNANYAGYGGSITLQAGTGGGGAPALGGGGGNVNIYGGNGGPFMSGGAVTIRGGNPGAFSTTYGSIDLWGDSTIVQGASTTAFQIQNSTGTPIFTADATGAMAITLGTSGNTITFTGAGGLVAAGTARHTKTILLTPEYAGAVLDALNDASCTSANSGTMTSGYDFTNRMNYYDWTSASGSAQCYDVVVQVPIPSDFSAWAASNPIDIRMKKDSTGTAAYAIQITPSSGSSTNYGSFTAPATITTSWSNMATSDLSGGTYTAGDYMTIKIRMTSTSGANVQIGNIKLQYLSAF